MFVDCGPVGGVCLCASLAEAGRGFLVAGATEAAHLQIIFIKFCIRKPAVSLLAGRFLSAFTEV